MRMKNGPFMNMNNIDNMLYYIFPVAFLALASTWSTPGRPNNAASTDNSCRYAARIAETYRRGSHRQEATLNQQVLTQQEEKRGQGVLAHSCTRLLGRLRRLTATQKGKFDERIR